VAVPADVTTAAELLGGVAGDLDVAGRALGASNAALPVPDEPLARLWHAATVLREHRGDGHVAALVAADIDGAEALALRAGTDLAEAGARSRESGAWTRAQLQPVRGWTDGEWDAASGRLARRGLLSADGTATPAGVHLHQAIEGATDAAAARPWARVPDRQAAELERLLVPVARACATALPYPNPIGVPMPAAS
jgi:hypothetical protein